MTTTPHIAPNTERVDSAHVNRAEALRYLGHAGQELSPDLEGRLDAAIQAIEAAAAPAFTFAVFPALQTDDAIELDGAAIALRGRDIRTHLAGAQMVAVCACTLGIASERALQRATAQSALDALLMDAAGSSLIEEVANVCEARIAAYGGERELITNSRFSPGYGDLPLDVQPGIVRTLDAQKAIGVSVTESNLVIPRKSITAFIGLFDPAHAAAKEGAARVKFSCTQCVCADSCALRKAGSPCYR